MTSLNNTVDSIQRNLFPQGYDVITLEKTKHFDGTEAISYAQGLTEDVEVWEGDRLVWKSYE